MVSFTNWGSFVIEICYFFRKPSFPIICNVDGDLIVARSPKSFQNALDEYALEDGRVYDIVARSSESWGLHSDQMIVSPVTFKKRWTKREVIDLFNDSRQMTTEYSTKSLSSKRFEKIFNDVVDLIVKARKREIRSLQSK